MHHGKPPAGTSGTRGTPLKPDPTTPGHLTELEIKDDYQTTACKRTRLRTIYILVQHQDERKAYDVGEMQQAG